MKLSYLLILTTLFSCKEYITEKGCFEGEEEKKIRSGEFKLDTPEKIIKANPAHVKFTTDHNVISFEQNKEENEPGMLNDDEAAWKKSVAEYNSRFAGLSKYFKDQFLYIAIQKENKALFGIAENQFGYWFLEVKNNIPNAYYIGLSNYTFLNKKQPEIFVKGNKLMLYGSFIRVKEDWAYPYGPQMEAVKNHLHFECDLKAIKKDSDKDRFNDLFEKLVLLNPDSPDTDRDGISDFTDVNPLYKQEQSKFTDLYSQIIDFDYQHFNFAANNYSFTGYFSDCGYFQKINPTKVKVLIYPENERYTVKSDYRLNMFPEYVGKIKKDNDGTTFYINFGSGAGGGHYKAVYEKGKWVLSKQSTHSI